MAQQDLSSPGQRVLAQWQSLAKKPMGKPLFSWLLGRSVPYSGALGARVQHLEPGHCEVTLRDRRALRNHLRSVHALALANLGELVSGLAMLTLLPPSVQGIVIGIDTRYHKKARGLLTAESRHQVAPVSTPREEQIQALIRDAQGDTVATVTVTWTLRPRAE